MKSRLHTRQITFRQLEIFKTVADLGSVTQAAVRLHLGQPTVSTQLAKLEEALGLALFERSGRQIVLTDAGHDVRQSIRRIFDGLDDLEACLDQRMGLRRGRLRLAVVTTAKYWVPTVLGPFCEAHPDVELEFHVGNRADIRERLQAKLDDLYIFSHPPRELPIQAQPLTENPLVVIAPATHPLTRQSQVAWHELDQERILLREQGSGTRFALERFLSDRGWCVQRSMTIASSEAIKESVAAGLGLGIISRHALTHMARGNVVELPVEGFPIRHRWYLVSPAQQPLTPVAQAFAQHLLAHAGAVTQTAAEGESLGGKTGSTAGGAGRADDGAAAVVAAGAEPEAGRGAAKEARKGARSGARKEAAQSAGEGRSGGP